MAKTYEELLEQAAIIRDETAAGKNTATRVGGTITDAVDYVKELKDTYEVIRAEAADAKTNAAAAKSTAEQAKQSATNAFDSARSAVFTANAANGTANEAKTTAEEAQTAAQLATSNATAAKTIANNAANNAKAASTTANNAANTATAAQAEAAQIRDDLENNIYNWANDQDAGYSPHSDKYYHGLMPAADKEKMDGLDARFELLSSATSSNADRLDALENPPAPDYAEMIIEAPATRHYKLFYDVRCIGWLEIDGEEAELPVITVDRSAGFYAVLSQGRHVVRFRPKEGNMTDGTPYKERQGLLGWCADNCVTEITLPEGWTVINTKMFEGAATLRRVNLPSTIREVRFGAFGECAALEEIVLPPSVATIQHFIAHDCPSLKRIVLGGGNITATGTLAQSCAALECVEFRAGGTVKFSGSANTFINLPQLARFIIRGNFPTFECSQPFTSTGYVGSGAAAEVRWIFTRDGLVENGTKWQTSLLSQCGFTAKKILDYTLN